MNDDQLLELISVACDVRERAYAKYSNFLVGAALLTEDGQIIAGCNVENASFGLTICAERNALFAAVAHGHRHFKAIALATKGGALPCGACRQVLVEFCDDLPIWIIDTDHPEQKKQVSLKTLLPGRFTL